MTTIKIINGPTARRITVTPTTEWSTLSRTLSTLFNLPVASTPSLSYTDVDDDTVTLDTTAELQDAIAQGTTRFRLNDSPNAGEWVLEGTETPRTVADTASVRSGIEGLSLEEPKAPPKYSTTVEEEEEKEVEDQANSVEKGKQKEKMIPDEETKQQQQPEEEQAPFVKIAQQLERLCEQFRDVLEQNPELVATAHELMDQVNRNVSVDIDEFASWLNGRREGATSGSSTAPFDFFVQLSGRPVLGAHPFFGGYPGWHNRGFGGHPGWHRGGFRGGRCGPWGRGGCPGRSQPEEQQPLTEEEKAARAERCRAWKEARGAHCQRRCGGDSDKALTEEEKAAHAEKVRAWKEAYCQRRGESQPESTEEELKARAEQIKAWKAARAAQWGRLWEEHLGQAQGQELSTEELKSKIGQLNDMGFFDEDVEELLKRYNGNVERVVEIVVQRQNTAPQSAPVAQDEEMATPYSF
ncbi:hypothetical protein BC938DRAFT_479417 [Jimgerdemannia flammicorona]|uniref:UBA domain-containing protein n=1 Tax=Jimgerdemannia flammicorona TaxID=994334 RepID=A0A433QKV1_9FUNG|nr:hypothetical protein BC938DRAFT_479417 [Jimgerdemannia flammicorona]